MTPLPVVQAFALLATDPSKGTRLVDQQAVAAGIAGALVSDLLVSGRIGRNDRGRLVVIDPSFVDVTVLDTALGMMTRDEKPRSVGRWISRFESSGWRTDVLDTLVVRGDLRKEDHRILGLFQSPRYPATTGTAGKLAFESMAEVLSGARAADDATAALIGLCEVTGLLRKLGLARRAAKPYLKVDVIRAVRSSLQQHRSSGAGMDGGAGFDGGSAGVGT